MGKRKLETDAGNGYEAAIAEIRAGLKGDKEADAALLMEQMERYREQLEDCVVTAPMDGVVTKITAKEGDMTTAATSLAVITSFDDMRIKIKINEYDLMGASVGEDVQITLKAIDKD